MKRFYLVFLFLTLLPNLGSAQHYGNALGLRISNSDLGRMAGLSYQHRVSKRITLEGIIQSDFSRNTTGHILYELHRPIVSKRLNYYYGAGLALGNEESVLKDESRKELIHTYGNTTIGADLVAGLELTLLRTVISLDYKPNFNIAGREEFYRGQTSISVRMVLQTAKSQKKKQRARNRAKKSTTQIPLDQKIKGIFEKK